MEINPDNFINQENEPIPISNGFIYDVEQEKEDRTCPHCYSNKTIIKSAYGYHIFERFGKRAMMIITYSKKDT